MYIPMRLRKVLMSMGEKRYIQVIHGSLNPHFLKYGSKANLHELSLRGRYLLHHLFGKIVKHLDFDLRDWVTGTTFNYPGTHKTGTGSNPPAPDHPCCVIPTVLRARVIITRKL